jgi:hypothetical protein
MIVFHPHLSSPFRVNLQDEPIEGEEKQISINRSAETIAKMTLLNTLWYTNTNIPAQKGKK